jgi:hypothetical protein
LYKEKKKQRKEEEEEEEGKGELMKASHLPNPKCSNSFSTSNSLLQQI